MKTFLEFINEEINEIPRNSLDPTVFQFFDDQLPILNTGIKMQIIKDVERIEDFVSIKSFYITGEILSQSYTKNCKLDVMISVFKQDMDNVIQIKVLSILKHINGRLAIGTVHPIYYHITLTDGTDENISVLNGIYDVINERWIKEPKSKVTCEAVDKNLIIFGNFNPDSEHVDIKSGTKKDDHYLMGLVTQNGLRFRYVPATKYVYWWEWYELENDKHLKTIATDAVEYTLKQYGYKVLKHVNMETPENYEDAHRQKYDLQYNRESFKIFVKNLDYITEASSRSGKNIVYFGTYDYKSNEIFLEQGNSFDTHDSLDLPSPSENRTTFRFIPDLDTVFWWDKSTMEGDRHFKYSAINTVARTLKKLGYSGLKHQYIMDEDNFDISHAHIYENINPESKTENSINSFKNKTNRGINRKSLRQIPKSQQTDKHSSSMENIGSAKKLLQLAKDSQSGMWKITPIQMQWLSNAFPPTDPPNIQQPQKSLGNTGIILWLNNNSYFLVKPRKTVSVGR